MNAQNPIGRRELLAEAAATCLLANLPACGAAAPSSGLVVSVTEFGARAEPGVDNSRAIQTAVDTVLRRGGGTVLIPGRFRCGNILVSGSGLTLLGQNGWLIDGRLTIAAGSNGIEVRDVGILNGREEAASYALDVSGTDCRFTNIQLVKDPIAGGYQMYLRQPSAFCRFSGLKLKGSNGIMVAGHDHLFDDFELESTMSDRVGGDDAFAIKALGAPTYNIIIRNGVVRGYSAVASFGSEIGTAGRPSNYESAVRDVSVSDVTADRCGSLVFFKPGALIYDWRNGLVAGIRLDRLTLADPRGFRFTSGVRMIAARGAIIRDVIGKALVVRARARNQGVMQTAAIDLMLFDEGAPARIENVDLEMSFEDPYGGAQHAPNAPGYPIDHIVRIEKSNPRRGGMTGISIDVDGRGSRIGGVLIGAGLDDAVTLRRAHLTRVAADPPSSLGGGGIWSDSRVRLGDISVDTLRFARFGGRAFAGKP